jgi:hypothetical protein
MNTIPKDHILRRCAMLTAVLMLSACAGQRPQETAVQTEVITSAPAEPAPASLSEGAAIEYSSPEENDFAFVLPDGWTYDMTEDGADLRQLDDPLNFLPVTAEIDCLPRTDLSTLFEELKGQLSEEGFAFADPAVQQIVHTISKGAAIAVILILFVLPGILAALDRFITPKSNH